MSVRTVRLDEEAEQALAYIVHTTGLSVSGALQQDSWHCVSSLPSKRTVLRMISMPPGSRTRAAMPSLRPPKPVRACARRLRGSWDGDSRRHGTAAASLTRAIPSTAAAEVLRTLRESLYTTVAVLTEAFHMLSLGSYGADRLREFIGQGGLAVWFMDGVACDGRSN